MEEGSGQGDRKYKILLRICLVQRKIIFWKGRAAANVQQARIIMKTKKLLLPYSYESKILSL